MWTPLTAVAFVSGGASGLGVSMISGSGTLFTFTPSIAVWMLASLFMVPDHTSTEFQLLSHTFEFLLHGAMLTSLTVLVSFIRWSSNWDLEMRLRAIDLLIALFVYAVGLSVPVDTFI